MKSLLLLLMSIVSSVASAEVDDIFIGKFFDFDARNYGRSNMKQYIPSFNDSCLFVWIEQNACSTSIASMQPLSNSLRDSYVSNGPVFQDGDTLTAGSPMYFICQNHVFASKINEFLLFSQGLHGCGFEIYAMCSIPDSMKGDSTLFSGMYNIICSTSENIKLYYDRADTQKTLTVTTHVGGYGFYSYLADTGEKGKYDETIYHASLEVRHNMLPVFNTGTQTVPLTYLIGDFNGNGKVDMFLFYWDWDQTYKIIEFDRNTSQMKTYIDPSGC
jgi:hypothetical protein